MPIFIFDPTGYTPEEIMEELGTLLAITYEGAETRLLAEAVQRADKILELQDQGKISQQVALQKLAVERATALKSLREHSEAIVQQLRDENLAETLVKYAAEHGSEAAINQLNLIKHLPVSTGFTGSAVTAVTALQLDLHNRLENLNQRILRLPNDIYQKVLAENAPALVLGLDTSLQTQKTIVRKFLNQNVTVFTDRSGRNWRIGSYAEMAGRTAAQRSWSDAAVYRMRQAGLDLVTPVVGYDGCEMCHNWSGKIISIGGMGAGTYQLEHGIEDRTVTVTVAGSLWEARNQGFQHPNCRCTLKAYIPGVTTLSESSYNPEAEAAAKKQRALEREIREAKREAALAPDDATRRRAQEDIYRSQQKLKEHLNETGRTRQSYREQLHFADGGTVNPRGVKPNNPRPIPDGDFDIDNNIPSNSVVTDEQRSKALTELDAALRSIRNVHTLESIPEIRIQMIGNGKVGGYSKKDNLLYVDPTATRARLTTTHEIGHYVDWNVLGNGNSRGIETPKLSGVMQSIENSQAVQNIRKLALDAKNPTHLMQYEYLLRENESFARAYAQWIALESKDSVLISQIEEYRLSSRVSDRQWDWEDFEQISGQFNLLFKKGS